MLPIVLYRHEDILIFNVQRVVSQTIGWHGRWPGCRSPAAAVEH